MDAEAYRALRDLQERHWWFRGRRKVISALIADTLPAAPGEHFDLIVMLDVLEHIEADEAALERLRAMLKPGGTVLLTVPALPWLWSHHDEIHHHKRRYSRRRLGAALRAAGLEPVRIGFFNALLLPLAIAQRLVSRALGRTAPVDDMPPAGLNELLGQIFGFESRLVGRVPMPLSLSFFALARSVHG